IPGSIADEVSDGPGMTMFLLLMKWKWNDERGLARRYFIQQYPETLQRVDVRPETEDAGIDTLCDGERHRPHAPVRCRLDPPRVPSGSSHAA
ncbi:MAG: hypothetical protein ACREPJ_07525, partial [Rhodanobacteraceae bacterium]